MRGHLDGLCDCALGDSAIVPGKKLRAQSLGLLRKQVNLTGIGYIVITGS